jgi:hypothetical protein
MASNVMHIVRDMSKVLPVSADSYPFARKADAFCTPQRFMRVSSKQSLSNMDSATSGDLGLMWSLDLDGADAAPTDGASMPLPRVQDRPVDMKESAAPTNAQAVPHRLLPADSLDPAEDTYGTFASFRDRANYFKQERTAFSFLQFERTIGGDGHSLPHTPAPSPTRASVAGTPRFVLHCDDDQQFTVAPRSASWLVMGGQ